MTIIITRFCFLLQGFVRTLTGDMPLNPAEGLWPHAPYYSHALRARQIALGAGPHNFGTGTATGPYGRTQRL